MCVLLSVCLCVCSPSCRRGWGMQENESRKLPILFMPSRAVPPHFSLYLLPVFLSSPSVLSRLSQKIICFVFCPFPLFPSSSSLICLSSLRGLSFSWAAFPFLRRINQSTCFHSPSQPKCTWLSQQWIQTPNTQQTYQKPKRTTSVRVPCYSSCTNCPLRQRSINCVGHVSVGGVCVLHRLKWVNVGFIQNRSKRDHGCGALNLR